MTKSSSVIRASLRQLSTNQVREVRECGTHVRDSFVKILMIIDLAFVTLINYLTVIFLWVLLEICSQFLIILHLETSFSYVQVLCRFKT
jgi:hypothetical protein